MICATTRFCSCFACQHWRRQPQANQRTTMTKLRLSTKDCRDEPYRWLFATLPRHRWSDENHSIACEEQENVRDSPPSFGLKPLILLMHMLEPTLWPSTNDKLYLCKTTMLGQDAHFWHMNTLLLERAQSFVHLAHPTSSYPGTSAWALILNCKSDNWKKCFHMFPLKPGAHIGVDVFLFPDMTAPGQARGFGQWKSRLMFCPTIMPRSQAL